MALFGRKVGPPDLIGTWREQDGEDEMEFVPSGELRYRTPTSDDRVGVMLLTYRVKRDVIISNQPSHPNEERTRFALHGDHLHLTDPEGMESTWVRV